MLAVGLKRDLKGVTELEIEKPAIEKPKQVLVRILKAAIDGTDRAIVRYHLFDPPPEEDIMVLGHEAVGLVEAVGDEVKTLKVGDIVVPTVRRGCGRCPSCLHNQSDMCSTGLYTERGIHKLPGFFTQYIVDEEDYLVPVPKELEYLAILVEPLSIGEKIMEQIQTIQSRLPWGCAHPNHKHIQDNWASCKGALVIGAGPLGFLIVCLMEMYGMDTYVAINRPEDNIRVKLMKEMGARYIDSRDGNQFEIAKQTGPLDIIIDASGASRVALDLINILDRNGIYVLTGIPREVSEVCLDGDALVRQLVRYNQVVVGSINSNRIHFETAIKHLAEIRERHSLVLEKMITDFYPLEDYKEAFERRNQDQFKAVFDLTPNSTRRSKTRTHLAKGGD